MKRRAENRKTTKARWLAATEQSNRLFKQADKLEDAAYDLLSDGIVTSDTLEKFRIAKDEAAAKYAQARMAWEQAQKAFQQKDNETGDAPAPLGSP
ncbi:hypothetical protein [Pseudomonas vanderleydeniana]|uniref:Uncharacterized protein n=1 Tax=Pseudomonas vanderleydeniana TaxID=2745495 RepID=A0A9E6PH38_9PSED|nr:hypothetical protein [Pseudomonas vanderleydeniana]QXI26334.1 hypothetical protein HU752_020570 [Pseudomonas vanderleydeniana]